MLDIRFIIEIIILIVGIGFLTKAKMDFSLRQKTQPDNMWSKQENIYRYIGYGLCILDVILAGFIWKF